MIDFEDILSIVDFALGTRQRKHIIGGMLISAALLFAGMACTVITLKEDDEYDGRKH